VSEDHLPATETGYQRGPSIWSEREIAPDCILITDKTAIITGAAQGLGKAIALSFAKFGARVAICDRQEELLAQVANEIESSGAALFSMVLDVRDDDAVLEFVNQTAERFGGIDILVNNAGGVFFSDFSGISPKGEATMIRENFSSATSFIRCCLPVMGEGASIINVTSVEGHRAAPGFSIYAAMKAALANLTRTLSMELASRRIRINCIAPDFIPTEGMLAMSDSASVTGDTFSPTPWPEQGDPVDCAAAALFLASDMSRFVTGSTIHLDGGTYAAHGWKIKMDGNYAI
jgi:3-oxoacyl-[acyl-carrier protein] reductase